MLWHAGMTLYSAVSEERAASHTRTSHLAAGVESRTEARAVYTVKSVWNVEPMSQIKEIKEPRRPSTTRMHLLLGCGLLVEFLDV